MKSIVFGAAATAALVMSASAMATNQIVDAGGVGFQIVDPATGLIDGIAFITAGEPDNAVIRLVVGSGCPGGICNLSTMYVGVILDGFASYPAGPACQATLQDGAFHPAGNISRADPWPVGVTVKVDYDPGFYGSNVYYVKVSGPPKTALDNSTNPPAAVFVPGRQLRINVMCGPK